MDPWVVLTTEAVKIGGPLGILVVMLLFGCWYFSRELRDARLEIVELNKLIYAVQEKRIAEAQVSTKALEGNTMTLQAVTGMLRGLVPRGPRK